MGDSSAAKATHIGMSTEIAHMAFGRHVGEALQAVENEARRLESLLSRFLPDSDVSRINRSAGLGRETISSETYRILACARECSVLSEGVFDVTVGPLVDQWDFQHASEPPANNKIEMAIPLVNYRDLELDAVNTMARLKNSGQSVDLGGIAKGYAGDHFIETFKEYGATSAYSNIGGNVSTLANKPDGSPWCVGIRHPRLNSLLGVVAVTGDAVVTSGDYERYFIDKKGERYHHILDPLSGYPAESGLISVTIVANSAMVADALSTAVFVAGMERGIALIGKHPRAEAVLVDAQLRVYVTRGLRYHFQATSGLHLNYL